MSIMELANLPGVIDVAPIEYDQEEAGRELESVARQAIDALEREREREGAALGEQLNGLIRQMDGFVGHVDALKDAVVEKFRRRLSDRVNELQSEIKGPVEPGRVEMEVALYADRCDISEELVRLRAHLERAAALIGASGGEPAGKNLEFLTQELAREVNTICSKSRDTELTGLALEMKSTVEKIREQVQNIE
jgi:uncharacterized protein (TIGR00255 family)